MKQREIKFRLRDKTNKIVGYEVDIGGEWWYSYDNNKWSREPILVVYRDKTVRKEQYTGFTDVDEREIYEHDILKVGDSHVGIIEYIERLYGGYDLCIDWVKGDSDGYFDGCPASNYLAKYEMFERIGDVYTNPELLEVNKHL